MAGDEYLVRLLHRRLDNCSLPFLLCPACSNHQFERILLSVWADMLLRLTKTLGCSLNAFGRSTYRQRYHLDKTLGVSI